MAVIKQAHSARLTRDAVVLDMGDLGRQAQRILSDAREQAERIVLQARAEAERLVTDANQRGHHEGHEQGLIDGREHGRVEARDTAIKEWRERLEQLAARWTDALSLWDAQRTAMLHEAQEDVITFAMTLARKVVFRTIQNDGTIVRDQLAAALELLGKSKALEVVIHPEDRALVEEEMKSVMERIATCQHASIQEDPAMSPGGCVIKTTTGRVDASIETQLNRIAEALIPEVSAASA